MALENRPITLGMRIGSLESVCPACGSEEVERRHHPPDSLGECYYLECQACEHQWDHA